MLKLFQKYLYNNFRKHSETDNLLLNKKKKKWIHWEQDGKRHTHLLAAVMTMATARYANKNKLPLQKFVIYLYLVRIVAASIASECD